MNDKPRFDQWFDINKDDHRLAYRMFRKFGVWPEWFKPSGSCEMGGLWTVIAAEQYINWLEYQLEANCPEALDSQEVRHLAR